jgi:hypothetical protein
MGVASSTRHMQRLFLPCTPRTGNTWFRKMLASSLQIVEVAAHTPAEIPWHTLPAECIVAMHWHCSEDFRAFLGLHGFTAITTTRHPLDVLISVKHFSQHVPATAQWLCGEGGDERGLLHADPTSPAFLEYAVSDRAAALLAVSAEWLDHAVSVIRYEELVACPKRILSGVIADIGQSARRPLAKVVSSHTLERLRPLSQHHFWRGEPGLWRTLITAEFRAAISHRHQRIFAMLGYDCECASAPSPERAREAWRVLGLSLPRTSKDRLSSDIVAAPADQGILRHDRESDRAAIESGVATLGRRLTGIKSDR